MKRNYDDLVWNIWTSDHNNNKITVYNILNKNSHTVALIKECIRKHKPIKASEIQDELMYHHWGRVEYEINIVEMCNSKVEKVVDWFMQVAINFEQFLEYLEKNLNIEIVRDAEDKSWIWN